MLICMLAGHTTSDITLYEFGIYLIATMIISYVFLRKPVSYLLSISPTLLIILFIFVSYVSIQLIPLPPEIWTWLPGRSVIIEGYTLLEAPLPWMPISMTPERSLLSVMGLLPGTAIYLLVTYEANETELKMATLAFLIVATISTLLGISQVFGSDLLNSSGIFNGLFANENHNVTFAITAIPFAGLILSQYFPRPTNTNQTFNVKHFLSILLIFAIFTGVLLSQSRAGYILIGPVLISTALFIMFEGRLSKVKSCRFLILTLCLIVVGIIFALNFSPVKELIAAEMNETSKIARLPIAKQSVEIMREYMPFGSGLGSFVSIYKVYEVDTFVGNIYVNHAHNDILEFLLEMGLVGGGILISFLIWITQTVGKLGFSKKGVTPMAKAAIICVTVISFHSIVDYPLRTIAISGLFGFCLGVISRETAPKRATLRYASEGKHQTS